MAFRSGVPAGGSGESRVLSLGFGGPAIRPVSSVITTPSLLGRGHGDHRWGSGLASDLSFRMGEIEGERRSLAERAHD